MRSSNVLVTPVMTPVPWGKGMSWSTTWAENLLLAVRTLWANRLRSSLTMLGLVIGIGSVILIIALGVGAQKFVSDQFKDLGTNVVAIFEDGPRTKGRQPITLEDVEALRTQVQTIANIAPIAYGGFRITRGDKVSEGQLAGVPESLTEILNISFLKGRFFTPTEMANRATVVILGEDLAKKVFGYDDPIGKLVILNNRPMTVVGVTKAGFFGSWVDLNRGAMVPLPLAMESLVESYSPFGKKVAGVLLQAKPDSTVNAVTFEAKNLLRQRHQVTDQEDFILGNIQDQIDIFNNVAAGVSLVLGLTAAISLVVSGIGIMNIMLVSVTERTREIGLRKALGASEEVILTQFILEAVLISVVGGTVGILLGAGLALAIGTVSPLKPEVTPWAIALAVGVSGGIGLFFGVFPAQRAARLDPITALRSD
ncbi:ABC transporter permease [Candidatus Cyanaurora vandensis]|uniref:ABC transporter permease n=1 Tax=Candidatus Cyanaurora vandensis TaxID=2714958 RepID=UPI00257D9BDC|nr:ABC transporter permease [Candidatus Cyanaurora vandensis]